VTPAADRRGWWTGAIAAVAAFWTYVLSVRPAHYDFGDDVGARIVYLHTHVMTDHAMTMAVFAMLFTYAASVAHIVGVVAMRARVIPLASAVMVTLGAFVMLVSTGLYMLGMAGFSPAHVGWILPAEMGSATVLAVAGVQSWRIARRDLARRKGPTLPAARALS
jgi:hypothetical protein